MRRTVRDGERFARLYTEILAAYAAAMPSGRWYGRPLEGDVNSGLGCPQLGPHGAPA